MIKLKKIAILLMKNEYGTRINYNHPVFNVTEIPNQLHRLEVQEVDNAIVVLTNGDFVFTHLSDTDSDNVFMQVVDARHSSTCTAIEIYELFEEQFR